MPEFIVHARVPSGFVLANDLQQQEFVDTGSVQGASKVALVATTDDRLLNAELAEREGFEGYLELAVRLRPPRFLKSVRSSLGRSSVETVEDYIREYNNGWNHAVRSTEYPTGKSDAYEDGYLDRAAGRAKWHLTHCADHDNCGEG